MRVFGEMVNILKSNQQCLFMGRWQFGEMAIWGDGNFGRWQFGEMGMYPNITIFPFGVYIVRRPVRERELSADIFPARERSKIAD